MRYIVKTKSLDSLDRWKDKNKNKSYDDLGKEQPAIKSELKDKLIREQKYICCYCEREVNIDNSHIEHFLPQSGETQKCQLDYKNLLICCCDKTTCGSIKDKIVNPLLVSPLEKDSLSHFVFQIDGSILGTDARGEFTIKTLNLDCDRLKQQRKYLIDSLIYCIKGGCREYIDDYMTEKSGKYNPLYSTAEYLITNKIL